MELIGTADGGVVLENANEASKLQGKPSPYSSLLSNLDSTAWPGGVAVPRRKNFAATTVGTDGVVVQIQSEKLNNHPGASRPPPVQAHLPN
jgi:hypothetical protein